MCWIGGPRGCGHLHVENSQSWDSPAVDQFFQKLLEILSLLYLPDYLAFKIHFKRANKLPSTCKLDWLDSIDYNL
jgi:hypothetical protein